MTINAIQVARKYVVTTNNDWLERLKIPASVGCLAVLCSFGIFGARGSGSQEGKVNETRTVLEKWVETRKIISEEKRDGAEQVQFLEDRIALIQREIDGLRSRTSEANDSLSQADKQRDELLTESEQLKEASSEYLTSVLQLENGARKLIARLPNPVLDRIKTLSQRIPTESKSTKLSLSERYLNIVGILNEVGRFNREITLKSEVHELPNGRTAEVAVMYVGLGHAYYVTNNGEHAGVGSVTEEGWAWRPNDEAAANISKAIGILRNEIPAEYVRLPMQFN